MITLVIDKTQAIALAETFCSRLSRSVRVVGLQWEETPHTTQTLDGPAVYTGFTDIKFSVRLLEEAKV